MQQRNLRQNRKLSKHWCVALGIAALFGAFAGKALGGDGSDVQVRLRFAGPLMGKHFGEVLFGVDGGAEIDIGAVLIEAGGYAILAGELSTVVPFVNLGSAWTFADERQDKSGSWQGRIAGMIGYEQFPDLIEVGTDDIFIDYWNALALTAAIDGTWWFSTYVGLELRFKVGSSIAVSINEEHDGPFKRRVSVSEGTTTLIAIATVGLTFGFWDPTKESPTNTP